MSNYRDSLEAYLKTLDISATKVLDVGGASNPVSHRVAHWDVIDYKIADNGLESGKFNFKYDVNCDDWYKLYKEKFEYVFCLEVMEYVYRPDRAVRELASMLVDGGILFITLPFIYPVHEPKTSDYLRYTCDGAARLLGENGFKILKIVSRDMTPKGFEFYKQFMQAEGFHASKHSRHDQLGWIIKAQKL